MEFSHNPITNSIYSSDVLAYCFQLCCYLKSPHFYHALCPGGSHFFSSSINFTSLVLRPFSFVISSFYSTGSYPSSPYLKSNTKYSCQMPPRGILIFCLSLRHVLLLLLSHFSHVRLCATPQMAAHQASPSLGFSRQEHWSGLPFPSPMCESEK